MKQEKAAASILVELLNQGIIQEKDQDTVFSYLMQSIAVGYDLGLKVRSNKRSVAQFSKDGKLINIHESAAAASRHTGVDNSDIGRCAMGKAHTAGGFRWKYVNKKAAKPEPTVGAHKLKIA